MTEWIVTSSAMILIIIALRGLLKGKISLRLQYGLWALVLVRLLIPFSIVESTISVSNILSAPVIRQADNAVADYESAYDYAVQRHESSGSEYTDTEIRQQVQQELFDRTYTKLEQEYAQTGAAVPQVQIQSQAQQQVQAISLTAVIMEALPYLWILGMIVVAAALIGSNLHFGWKLRKSRTPLDIPSIPLNTYLTDYVATPCLFGTVTPDIYLTNEVMTDAQMRRHVLAHEMSHYRQGDHIWSVLRCVCLVLHWYNPLVWAAAILSKQDAELACDEATIKALGEAERVAYGRTLIGMTCVRRDPRSLMLTATTMLGTKKTLKERISLIAKKPKTALYTLIACILVVSLAVGCTFTGAPTEPFTEPTTVPTDGPTSEPTDPTVDPTEAQNPVELLEQCRVALEELQSRDSFELIQEVSSSDPDVLAVYSDTRYIHSGDDWIHIKAGNDVVQMYLQIDNRQYVKYITRAIPEEDRVYTTWAETDLSTFPLSGHCWLMDFQWDADSTVFHKLESDGTANEIFVYVHHGDDTRALYTFRFDIETGALLSVTRIVHGDDGHAYSNRVSVTDASRDDCLAAILEHEQEVLLDNAADLMRIQQFQDLLKNDYWYRSAIGCIFEDPAELPLYYLLYNGVATGDRQNYTEFTDSEVAFLKDVAVNSSWRDESAWVNAHKMPRQYIDEMLHDYFGISIEDVTVPEEWSYFGETDSYYYIRSDAYGVNGFTVTDVQTDNNGLIYVCWTTNYLQDTRVEEATFINQPQMVLTLQKKADGGYLILSNLPVE